MTYIPDMTERYLNLIGVIITNGYRYEYSDVVKKKGYTLNPKTGRLSSY